MSGLNGGNAWFAFARQSGKGTPATPGATTDKVPFSGGDISPNPTSNQLQETDATRNQGNSYKSVLSIAGAPQFYVRDANFHHVADLALGTTAHSGTTNYTHTTTQASVLPYLTAWKQLGGSLWERFDDCKVNEWTVSADAGSPLVSTFDLVGSTYTRLTSDPLGAATLANGAVYNYNEAAVTYNAVAGTRNIGSFELTVTNNVSLQQTDDIAPYDVVEGLCEISLGFDLIFEDLLEYNYFNTGTTTGTTATPNTQTRDLIFAFTKGANNAITFTIPNVAVTEFKPEPSPTGDPIVVPVRGVVQRPASGSIITVETKNQVAT
jgi:hypothetical protein